MSLVARQGWRYIAPPALAAAVVHYLAGGGWAAPLWLLTAGVVYLFRDPDREIPSEPLGVICPVDGTVVSTDTVHDSYLEREAVCISIEMGHSGVFATRSPVEGKIAQRWYSARALDPAGKGPNADVRPRYGIWIETDEREDVVLVMNSGARWNRPQCYVQYGERIGQGQRCGFIQFGARVDLLLPANTRVEVQPGDTVVAGTSVLGKLVNKP